jgi:hypothetical protein
MIEEHEDHDDAAESVDGDDPASRRVYGGLRGSIDCDHYPNILFPVAERKPPPEGRIGSGFLSRPAPEDYNCAIVKENRRA